MSFEAEYRRVENLRIWLAYASELLKEEKICVTHGQELGSQFEFLIPQESFAEQLKEQIEVKKHELQQRTEALHRMIDGN